MALFALMMSLQKLAFFATTDPNMTLFAHFPL